MISRIVTCPICNEEVIAKGMIINSHFRIAREFIYDGRKGLSSIEVKCSGSERIISDEMPKLPERESVNDGSNK